MMLIMYLKMEDILNSENMIPIENVKELIDELQQKENIIKEVREYMKDNIRVKLNEEFGETIQYKSIYSLLEEIE